MKKILLLVLSIICMFSFATASACTKDEDKKTGITVINSFDTFEEIVYYKLNPTAFSGNWAINRDEQYIVEGTGSWKINVHSTKPNQPNFKTRTTYIKKYITDTTAFGMWVYNTADYSFDLIITAYAGENIICSPIATVNPGANDLVFTLNRALVSLTGQMVTDYSISFTGIKGDTVIYIDNFHAKTTTEPYVMKKEVKDVVDGITNLSTTPTRQQVETLIAKYNALSSEDKLCVSNSNRLKAAMSPFYLSDLATAQEEDPGTLLYFDKQFGEVQVEGITEGIAGCSFSTAQKIDGEEGSLKVEFTPSSTNWVTVSTSANILIEEEYLEFYLYNDSDQVKAVCVGWHAPMDAQSGIAAYVIEPRTWTKIECKSTDLTDAGGASGGIQICGLESRTVARALAPSGAMYISSVVKRDYGKEAQAMRTGEDANTLYFFDRQIGLKQIKGSGANFAISTEVKYGNEQASLAITTETAIGTLDVNWETLGYNFNSGDYVVFYAYNDTDADFIDLSLSYFHRQRLHKGEWNMVIWKASDVSENNWSWLIGYKYPEQEFLYASGVDFSGTVYFTKAKVYTSSQVKDLTAVESDYEYTVGESTFIGQADMVNGTFNPNSAAFNDDTYRKPFFINGTLRWQTVPKTTHTYSKPYAGFTFKNEQEVTDNSYLYVTFKGGVENEVYAQLFNNDGFTATGHYTTVKGELVETLSDGFAVYKFKLKPGANDPSALAKATELKSFRLGVNNIAQPVIGEVIVSNVVVKSDTNA